MGPGVLLLVAALDEGSAFESARRPGTILNSVQDELGVMGASVRPVAVPSMVVYDDENEVLRAQARVVPAGDVEGETGTLGAGVLRVCAICRPLIFVPLDL